jgi:methylated-DNA-[protein]-cysteine S-methyltransferase
MPAQTSVSFALFDTAVGRCAIAWSACGIVAVLLPERDDAALRARLRRRHPAAREAAPSDEVTQAIDGIVALVAGEPRDLAYIALDLTGVPEFNRRVYAAARAIRPGETLTYGAIAARLGEPDARRIGEAMSRNPCPIIIPCHRVVAAGGIGGFSHTTEGYLIDAKRWLLMHEARADEFVLRP